MKYFFLWLGMAACLAGSVVSTRAVGNIYLNIPGIPGESNAQGYQNQIAVTAFTEGVESITSIGTEGATPKAQFDDIVITKPVDKSSPLLYLNCAKATKLTDPVVLTVTRSNGTDTFSVAYTLTLTTVYIKSVTTSTDSDGSLQETLTLTCAGNMQWSYIPINPSGQSGTAITHNWNLSTSTGN